DRQLALLQSFADQAVIAIENARLLDELNARNREASDSLEQQKTTSEILRVIASSPGDRGRAIDTICQAAQRQFGAAGVGIRRIEGDRLRYVGSAGIGLDDIQRSYPDLAVERDTYFGFATLEMHQIHVPDMDHHPPEYAHFESAGVNVLSQRSGNR